jgi:hypothetical protein
MSLVLKIAFASAVAIGAVAALNRTDIGRKILGS